MNAPHAPQLADQLRAMLAAIHSGELVASAATAYRIEGAIVALDALGGESIEDIVERLVREANPRPDVDTK